jgi:hypothetical protein|tara:strand:- start:92 stop:301 length:210 start_codon:yes stop_codon:yes gene_type:complete
MKDKKQENLERLIRLVQPAIQTIEDESGKILEGDRGLANTDSAMYNCLYKINQEAHKILKPIRVYINHD